MKANDLKREIASIASHILFNHKGKACGVDPMSTTCFDMWCGDSIMTVKTIDEVMNTPFFNGDALRDIAEIVEFE